MSYYSYKHAYRGRGESQQLHGFFSSIVGAVTGAVKGVVGAVVGPNSIAKAIVSSPVVQNVAKVAALVMGQPEIASAISAGQQYLKAKSAAASARDASAKQAADAAAAAANGGINPDQLFNWTSLSPDWRALVVRFDPVKAALMQQYPDATGPMNVPDPARKFIVVAGSTATPTISADPTIKWSVLKSYADNAPPTSTGGAAPATATSPASSIAPIVVTGLVAYLLFRSKRK